MGQKRAECLLSFIMELKKRKEKERIRVDLFTLKFRKLSSRQFRKYL